jgi:4-hydroxybenzoate polyprenyltransferase
VGKWDKFTQMEASSLRLGIRRREQGVVTVQNLTRSIILFVLCVVLFVVLMVFLTLVLKIALVVALLAFAYYWFTKATHMRRRSKYWR